MLDKKTDEEIKILRQGGKILGQILRELAARAKVGVTGLELDRQAETMIKQAGGEPSFKNFKGYPHTLCVSINETIVHGVPTEQPFKSGDLVGIDIGMKYRGLYTDTAMTVGIGHINNQAQKLLDVTKQALTIGIQQVKPGKYIGDIGRAIEQYVRPFGFGIVKDLAGHGVGRDVHEAPLVPNYISRSKTDKMFAGLVIAIGPMIILGAGDDVITADNGWDVQSQDQSLTAHFEHTVAVTKDGYLIITE